MTFHDPRDAQRYRARLRKQRDYQRKYRERLGSVRAPERDDVASAALRVLLDAVVAREPSAALLVSRTVDTLEKIGFDRAETMRRLRKMLRHRAKTGG